MRIANILRTGKPTLAVRTGGDLVDLSLAAPKLPSDVAALIGAGKGALGEALRAAKRAPRRAVVTGRVSYLPPVSAASKIFCIGLNYRAHTDEYRSHSGQKDFPEPEYPVVFARYPTSFVGHLKPILVPRASRSLDWEGELVIVIGRGGRSIPRARALDHVAGYTIANEGSVRDFQFFSSQWIVGKTFENSGALGPEIVTADELPKGAKGLRIATRVNGAVKQDANTRDMIFDVARLVHDLSVVVALSPGDMIVSGTPDGVGFTRTPPEFMRPGDRVEIEIEGVGRLVNPVKREKR